MENVIFMMFQKLSRTRDFFISAFTNHGVFNYIKDNIEKFDRDFLKTY